MVVRELRVPLYLLLLTLFTVFTLPARGSAPPPLIRASQSANGKFLVVTEWEFENPEQQGPHVIKKSIYRVLRVESFINAKDRLDSNSVFWTDTPWTVTCDGGGSFYPLISNTGQYLVLLRLAPAFPNSPPVLEIYHREFSAGVLKTVSVRQISITDLWTPREIDPEGDEFHIQTGATPQWFSGGSLNFSADDENLIYRTQWNDVLIIRLADGSITPQVR
jgi:hypothetical protein